MLDPANIRLSSQSHFLIKMKILTISENIYSKMRCFTQVLKDLGQESLFVSPKNLLSRIDDVKTEAIAKLF